LLSFLGFEQWVLVRLVAHAHCKATLQNVKICQATHQEVKAAIEASEERSWQWHLDRDGAARREAPLHQTPLTKN
jgi:hypothetical protein